MNAKNLPVVIFLLAVIAGCAGNNSNVYKLYPGPARLAVEVATLEFGKSVCEAKIDGLLVHCRDYGTLQLVPGRHNIEFNAVFGVSFLVNPEMQDDVVVSGDYLLEAGRHYYLQGDRTIGHGYTMYAWIEDAATGLIIFAEDRL